MSTDASVGGTLTYSFLSDGIVFDILITDLGDGRFAFDVSIDMDESDAIGDIRAFYFDIAGDVDTMDLSIEGVAADSVVSGLYDVALDDEYVIDEADVKKVDSNDTNVNGEVKGSDLFDVGVEFGHQGMSGGDDFQATSFILTEAEELTLEDFNLQNIGVRLTSVGAIDGSRDGSLKISDQTDGEINLPPVAEDDAITIGEAGAIAPAAEAGAADETVAALNILDNDSDPDGDPLTIVTAGGLAPGSAIAIVTAGGVATTVSVTAAGDLVFATDGAFDHLAEGESDSFQITYAIADPSGEISEATVTVTILGEEQNAPPEAADDMVTIFESGAVGLDGAEGVTATLNVFDNDSDPDGDPLTITSIGAGAAPGDAIAVTTANGVETTVTITAAGDVVFATNEAFDALGTGEFDSLTLDYTVSDSNGGEDSATVTINILGEDGPNEVNAVNYNIMFMVDMSGSMMTGGVSTALFGAGEDQDQNGDGTGSTQADAALLAISKFQAALQTAGILGDVDIGLGGFAHSDGDLEEYRLLTNGDQIVFDLDDDVSAAYGQAAMGGDTAFLGSPFAAANDFYAAAGGAEENTVNLFYIFSDGRLSIGSSDQVEDWVAELLGTFADYDPRTSAVSIASEGGGTLGQILGSLTDLQSASLLDAGELDAWVASEMEVIPDLGDLLIT